MSRLLLPALLVVAACGGGGKPRPSAGAAGHHEHVARYGGTLVELGKEEAHVELLLDPASGTLTAYLWDGEVEQPIRSSMKALLLRAKIGDGNEVDLSLAPVADPLTGEKAGDTARFEGTFETLKGHPDVEGQLLDLELRGRKYSVPFHLGHSHVAHAK